MSDINKTNSLPPLNAAELPAEASAILRIFGRNTLWLWLDLGALRIGTMLAGLFLIRYFGPANFGMYSMALAVGWVANAVIDLGLTRYAARAVAASAAEATPILSHVIHNSWFSLDHRHRPAVCDANWQRATRLPGCRFCPLQF